MAIKNVRAVMQAGLHQLGLENATSLGERYLIRSGNFAGIEFQFEELSAIYWVNDDNIKFVSKDGQVLKLMPLEPGHEDARKAA